jgi:hypothetical protein
MELRPNITRVSNAPINFFIENMVAVYCTLYSIVIAMYCTLILVYTVNKKNNSNM